MLLSPYGMPRLDCGDSKLFYTTFKLCLHLCANGDLEFAVCRRGYTDSGLVLLPSPFYALLCTGSDPTLGNMAFVDEWGRLLEVAYDAR